MKRNNIANIILEIEHSFLPKRGALFIWGTLLYALSFSIFFSPNDIVTGGSTGLGIIINDITGLDISTFVFIFSTVMLIIGFILMGKTCFIKTVAGVLLLPIFLKFTSIFNLFVQIEHKSLFLVIFIGGIILGLGNGLIIKSGFSVGGFQTIYQILYKYFYISIGKSTLIVNGILVIISGMIYGWDNALYAIIGLYIASVITDRVMLETSISKSFFIVTKKHKEINEYITDALGHSATIMNATGGYKDDNKKILMCSIPTRQYYLAKEAIQEIDEDAFFLITDTYEIYGGM